MSALGLFRARPAADIDAIRARWTAAWPEALAAWSRFTRLRPPTLCLTNKQATAEGLTGSFAMIRLTDQAVIVSLPEVAASHVESFPVEVLAHEIGHHVLAPATLSDHARSLARMRRALPTVERHAPMVANLYTDLLINDRLQRSATLRMADVYRALAQPGGGRASGGALWTLYLRIYEILWRLERRSLGGGRADDRVEGDAWLGARLVRSYARQWLDGSGRFAALLLPYLLEDTRSESRIQPLLDTAGAAAGGDPAGLTEVDPEEERGAIHPATDPALTGDDDAAAEEADGRATHNEPVDTGENAPARGQAREPFEYGEILKAAGIKISEHDAAVRYYRERALPHLVRYPSRRVPESEEPLPEGLEPWDLGSSLDDVDWLQSVLVSPRVVPGVTTVQRVWGTTEGAEPKRIPLDLDIYVDSSGSMANPQKQLSYPALAGAIVCLSALRAGARVQATLWSGTHQVRKTDGFVRDETEILTVLTGHLGGSTAFPIHVLRDTYAGRRADVVERPTHILVVSDDGVTTMFSKDERGNSGWDIAASSLARAGGGGTLVLNLDRRPDHYRDLARAQGEGWQIHRVSSWAGLLDFAREFSRRAYGRNDRR